MDTLETWWLAIKAEAELAGETLKPETIVLSYTGNGMIVFVTAQQMDEHFKKRHPGAEEE